MRVKATRDDARSTAVVPIPFSLHPDYDRRPRNPTGSADLTEVSARGLNALRVITAGGESHPALRTLPSIFFFGGAVFITDLCNVHGCFPTVMRTFSYNESLELPINTLIIQVTGLRTEVRILQGASS